MMPASSNNNAPKIGRMYSNRDVDVVIGSLVACIKSEEYGSIGTVK